MKLTEQLLIDKGFEFDKELQSYVKIHEENSIQIIISQGFFYPVLWQSPELSNEIEQRVSLCSITELEELETIWALFTGGTL